MEFVPGGDLGSLINESGHLPEVDVKDMARQLLSALKHLHGMGITHRDVKPDNILIFTREPFHVKLTDFGLSKMVDSEETFLRTFCGTLLYCAPEVYSEYREYDDAGRRNLRGADKKSLPPQRYGHAVDVWSLAGVLFYALCGSPPYPVKNGTSYQELLNHIMTQPLDIRPLQYATVSDSGIRFVRNMLHVRPEHRATVEELVCSSWLTGVDSVEASMDFDEVDMIGDGIIDPELEQGTSQLSIRNPDGGQIADSDEGIDNFSDLTEIQRLEIPSSFSTDSKSSRNGSYGFMQTNNRSRNGRLFGEVNASDLESSGAVPFEQLNLPVPTNHRDVDLSHSQESRDTESEFGYGSSRVEGSQVHPTTEATMSMPPPPPPHNAVNAVKNQDIDERAARSSSLMGAESMVGHLNMHSPASAPSPNADSPMATTEEFRPTISLRRPREEDVDDDGSWRPSDLPAKRRRRSEREIDMPLPPSIFWDPRDKSTHHYNYPRMSSSDLETYQEYAKMKGERFVAGQKTFEATMQSFRSSRSPSLEPEVSTRAHSEPTKEEGRRMLMKRDERKLATESNGEGLGSMSNGGLTLDEFIPSTAHPSNVDISPEPATSTRNGTFTNSQPVVGNDFQQPKRILAKLIATPDSCLPTITLNITESMTSWGRGVNATVRYTNGQEVRIPKYAFKILQFKPGFYAESTVSAQNPQMGKGREKDHDMTFYISSKASVGIWVNNINIPYFDRQNPNTESKFWGEIRHGDLITVWRHDLDPAQFTRFRFECYWGNSKEARKEGEEFRLLEDGDILGEIERICLMEERAILAEQARLQEQEKMMVQKEKEREKLARERPFNFNQSFPSAPQTS
jgi:serine/threonine protein kinase